MVNKNDLLRRLEGVWVIFFNQFHIGIGYTESTIIHLC